MPNARLLLPMMVVLIGCSEPKAPAVAPHEPATPSSTATNTAANTATARPVEAAPQQVVARKHDAAEPSATGTGCPPGTAKVAVDGNTVTVRFEAFAAEVGPSVKLAVKDCQIALPGVAHKRRALASMSLEGALSLAAGSKAKVMFNSYLQGNPGQPTGPEVEHVGPHDAPLALRREIPAEQRVWSECGTARDLNALARIRLLAASSDGSSTAKPSKLTLVLDEKPCSDG